MSRFNPLAAAEGYANEVRDGFAELISVLTLIGDQLAARNPGEQAEASRAWREYRAEIS